MLQKAEIELERWIVPQAPLSYVEQYYENRVLRRAAYPEVRIFYETQLAKVDGGCVLNIGCGPQFFDDLQHFASPPQVYIGLDRTRATFQFLEGATNTDLAVSREFADKLSVNCEFVCADLFDDELDFSDIDTIVSIGFLGIFSERKFKQAVRRVRTWLRPGGKLLNLSWCENHQDKVLYESRLQYQFNHPGRNPGPSEIRDWTSSSGLRLTEEAFYDVPKPSEYGWACIHSTLFTRDA